MGKHTAPRMGTELAAPPQQTAATIPKAQRIAERRGLDVDRVEHVTETSEIAFESGVIYYADGPIEHTGTVDVDHATNTGLVGTTDDARLVIPRGNWNYDIFIRGGHDLIVSGIDFDQRAGGGARGRIWMAGDNAHVEHLETLGLTSEPGYDPDDPSGHDMAGPTFYLPATHKDADTYLRDVRVVNGGTMQSEHWGMGPIGVWMATEHTGTLHVDGFEHVDCPSDSIYITNTTGSVDVDNSSFENCCTAAIRIAKGKIRNCEVSFDYRDTLLSNSDNPGNANVGIMIEAKQGESGVSIEDTTVNMRNVASCSAAIVCRNMTTPGRITRIENVKTSVSDNADDAADVMSMDAGARIDRVVDTEMSGTATGGESVVNYGAGTISLSNVDLDYPDGRRRSRGSVS